MRANGGTYQDVIFWSVKEQANQSMYGMFTYIYHCSLLCFFMSAKRYHTWMACSFSDLSGKQSEEKWSESAKSCLKDWVSRRLRLLEIVLQEQPETWCRHVFKGPPVHFKEVVGGEVGTFPDPIFCFVVLIWFRCFVSAVILPVRGWIHLISRFEKVSHPPKKHVEDM